MIPILNGIATWGFTADVCAFAVPSVFPHPARARSVRAVAPTRAIEAKKLPRDIRGWVRLMRYTSARRGGDGLQLIPVGPAFRRPLCRLPDPPGGCQGPSPLP